MGFAIKPNLLDQPAPSCGAARFCILWVATFIAVALAVAVMMLVREVCFAVFVDGVIPSAMIQADDVSRMRTLGVRFDARSATLLTIPLVIITFILPWFERLWACALRLMRAWCAIFFFVLVLLSIGNFFYIKTFHVPLDIFMFNFLHEEPKAVLVTVWQDYPVIGGSLLLLATTYLLLWVWAKLVAGVIDAQIWKQFGWMQAAVFGLIALTLFVLLARGSLTTRYPLRRNNAQVSVIAEINHMVLNAPMNVYYAWLDRVRSMSFTPVEVKVGHQLLKASGIETLNAQTPANSYLAKTKPNVAFFIMESMGLNMMSYDEAGKTDLLGRLRGHFQSDWVFNRFISSDMHTIQSTAQLLFMSPISQISTSSEQDVTLPGTPFATYKKAGYRTVFVTPGTTTWENMAKYLPRQHVDEVIDQTHLMDFYGLTKTTEWGLPDRFAFDYAAKLLKESKEPVFVVVLSTANHPPYHVPEGYKPFAIEVPELIERNYDRRSIDEALPTIMTTYQASCDALGVAITEIKSSHRPTVVGVTADHQMLGMKPIVTEGPFKERAVPFYVWASDDIKRNVAHRFDAHRVGSHKDVFPTLYAMSLSAADYMTVGGRNMLAVNDDSRRAFGYNIGLWVDDKGAYSYGEHPQFYPWINQGRELLTNYEKAQNAPASVVKKINAYRALDDWQILYRICGTTDHPTENCR